MKHPACSAEGVEANRAGVLPAVFLCVFHLIAGVIVAFAGLIGFALWQRLG